MYTKCVMILSGFKRKLPEQDNNITFDSESSKNNLISINLDDDKFEKYPTKELGYMHKSNISLQNSSNIQQQNILLQKYSENPKKNLAGWTSKIIFFENNQNQLIKKCYNQNLDSDILIENFNNEVNALIIMKGETHIPSIININSVDLSIILEYCGELLTQDNCPDNWRSQLIEIYQLLQKYHIYHNDIHLGNLCLKDGIIYLIDFGLAKHHIDWQYQNLSLELIENSESLTQLFDQVRQNGIQIRKCLFCDDKIKNI